jgi:acyl-CoA dehydrogenase
MLTLGGALKKKEMLSARLGDILSNLYLASMVLKHFENQGRREADLPLVEWSCRFLLYRAQEQLHGFLRNFPVRPAPGCCGWSCSRAAAASARRATCCRGGSSRASSARARCATGLCEGVYRTVEPGNVLGLLQEAMEVSIEVAAGEEAAQGHEGRPDPRAGRWPQLEEGVAAGIITAGEAEKLRIADEKIMALIHVDDFAPEDFQAADAHGEAGRASAAQRRQVGSEAKSTEAAEA